MHLGAGLAPSGQTVGSLFIPQAGKAGREKDLGIFPIDLTNSQIQPNLDITIIFIQVNLKIKVIK